MTIDLLLLLMMKLALPAQAVQDACECPDIIQSTTDQIRSMATCCKIKPDRQAWKLTSGKFKNKGTVTYQLLDAEPDKGSWEFTEAPSTARSFRTPAIDQLFYIEDPDGMVLELEGLVSRNVFRARKKENEPKQLWKKRKIDALGDQLWIVNSKFERHPRTNRDLVLTAMAANTLKLKGLYSQISLVNGDCWKTKSKNDEDCTETHGDRVDAEDVNRNNVMNEFTKQRRRRQNRRGKNKSKLKLFSTAGGDKYTDAWERFPVQATDDWDFQKDMTENECEEKLKDFNIHWVHVLANFKIF